MYVIICKGKVMVNPGIFVGFEKEEDRVDAIFRSGLYSGVGKEYKTFSRAQNILDKIRSLPGGNRSEVYIMPLEAWKLWNRSFYNS